MTVTVPVGCFNTSLQDKCEISIFILTPGCLSSNNSCKLLSNQGGLAFDEKICGIVISSSTWWKEKTLNVIGKSDGVINDPGDRNINIKLGSITKSRGDPSEVWYNFTMPDIKVSTYITEFRDKTFPGSA